MASSQSTVRKTWHDLPYEITIEILSRLPVKSLLRFKSVCKTWYDLIETPDFISKHLRTQVTLVPTSLLETTIDLVAGNNGFLLICYDGFDNDRVNIDFPFLDRLNNGGTWYDGPLSIVGICNGLVCIHYGPLSIVGICNGLVCIHLSPVGYPLILCNPSTRKFREIWGAEWNWFDENVHVRRLSFGFGFHPSANDYKLIRIILYYDAHSQQNIRADLYVMSTNTWTEIDVNKLSSFSGEIDEWEESASAVLNGVFYWPVRVVPTDQVVVMSFDMGDEVFRKIRTPECLDMTWHETNWQFVELYDKLALVVCFDAKDFDVWVLNENECSWTNQVKVGSLLRIASIMRNGEGDFYTVVGGGKNGELFVIEQKKFSELKLFSYDTKTRHTKDLCFVQVSNAYSTVYLYAGTLLPVMQANEIVLNK